MDHIDEEAFERFVNKALKAVGVATTQQRATIRTDDGRDVVVFVNKAHTGQDKNRIRLSLFLFSKEPTYVRSKSTYAIIDQEVLSMRIEQAANPVKTTNRTLYRTNLILSARLPDVFTH